MTYFMLSCLVALTAVDPLPIEFFCEEPLSQERFYTPLTSYFAPKGIAIEPFLREERVANPILPYPTVFYNFPGEFQYHFLQNSLLFIWDPPSVNPWIYNDRLLESVFRVYTWNDDLVDGKHFFKFYYPCMQKMIEDRPQFSEKSLCTLINSNKESSHPDQLYTAREEVIQFFERVNGQDFIFYGRGWENSGYRNYRGAPLDKIQTIKNFRFSICYENMTNVRGYISEKIFDCFTAGVVPIYWGATNIADYIPKNCFIDRRDFSSLEELYRFLKKMPESTWNQYIKNIRHFLESEKAYLFSWDHYLEIVKTSVDELCDAKAIRFKPSEENIELESKELLEKMRKLLKNS